jgi:leader peptidase (prepilin peptidase) / N-methyltransferase
MIPTLIAIYGLVLGSFFNVVICRLPDKKSLFLPSSHCPKCKTPIKPWHNIPIVSYIILGGKCASCRQPISIIYPLIELTTSIASLALWYLSILPQLPLTWMQGTALVIQSTFLLLLIPITIIDFKHYIIPDSLTLPFLCIGFGISFFPGSATPLDTILGVLAGGGSLYAIGWIGSVLLKKEAMGGGDIKLMGAAGALFGAQNALLGIVFGAALGSIFGITVMLLQKKSYSHQIPFGPFLGAGMWVAVFSGQKILDAYLSLFGETLSR